MENPKVNGRIDLTKPKWDQSTFLGRLKHFASITDSRLYFVPTSKLYEAKELLQKYKLGQEPPGTTDEQIWYASHLYGSAFHPDSGELQNVLGRMSFQATSGMILTAVLIHFYKTTAGVVTTQWVNQSYMAFVNYTNRNAGSTLTNRQMFMSYCTATGCALGTALGMKSFLSSRASPLLQRFVPLMAVAAANMINIPLTRQDELINGVNLVDENDNKVTTSRYAGVKGISQVIVSRIAFFAAPGMLLVPVLMEKLEKKRWFKMNRWIHLPFQTFTVGVILLLTVPVTCALFPQRSMLSMSRLQQLEPERYKEAVRYFSDTKEQEVLYFNKGL